MKHNKNKHLKIKEKYLNPTPLLWLLILYLLVYAAALLEDAFFRAFFH